MGLACQKLNSDSRPLNAKRFGQENFNIEHDNILALENKCLKNMIKSNWGAKLSKLFSIKNEKQTCTSQPFNDWVLLPPSSLYR